jgi:glyoxylase-like metal-dependent hydrolase (beta-lactamase superfamily II)
VTRAAGDPLPLCEAWFEAEQANDGLFRIVEPHVGVIIASNTWLVIGGERDLVVDTGNGLAPLRPFLQRLRPEPDKPIVAVATHAHMDHVCGLHEFEERLLHRADVGTAASPDRLLFLDEIWPGAIAQMAEAGYPVPELSLQAAPDRGFDPRAFVPPPATPTRVLEEGDVVDLGDRSFDVLHLPGHTHGSIGLWDDARGVLFSGDAVYALDPLLDTAPTSDATEYVATMRRLRELPVEIVHAGHDQSFGRDVLIERCDAYLARMGR